MLSGRSHRADWRLGSGLLFGERCADLYQTFCKRVIRLLNERCHALLVLCEGEELGLDVAYFTGECCDGIDAGSATSGSTAEE
jgi:hypothetical protein